MKKLGLGHLLLGAAIAALVLGICTGRMEHAGAGLLLLLILATGR